MAGLKGYDRTPRESVRDRRNSQRLSSNFTQMLGDGFEVDAGGLITVDVQDPIFVDGSGVGLNYSTGLQVVASNLTTKDSEIDHDSLLNFVADEHIDWTSASADFSTTGDIRLVSDTNRIELGSTAGGDAIIRYDGTNLIIDPDVAGSGEVRIGVFGAYNNLRAATIEGNSLKAGGIIISNMGTLTDGTYTLTMGSAPWDLNIGFSVGANLLIAGSVILGGTLTVGSGNIRDSGGTISFGDENLTTSGNVTIDSDTSGLILGATQDATLKWDNANSEVDLDTDFHLSGALGLGISANATLANLYTATTYTHQTGTRRGIMSYPVLAPAGALSGSTILYAFSAVGTWNSAVDGSSLGNVYGFFGGAQTGNNSGSIAQVVGLQCLGRHYGSGNVGSMYGVYSQIFNDDLYTESGNITSAYCYRAYAYSDKGSGNIFNLYGIYIDKMDGGGSLSNHYGIWIEDLSAITKAYAIVIDSDTIGIVMGADQDVLFRSSGPGVFDFSPLAANTDITLNFLGTTNSGVLKWMEDEDEFQFNDDISFNGSARIKWTKIAANGVSIRNSHGTSSDGVSDLQTAFDGNTYTLSEESGETPGMDIEVDFTGVTAFNWVRILGRYEQSVASHGITIMLEITPFNGSAWHRFDYMHDQGADLTNEGYSFFVPDDSAYINGGVVKVRFVHEMIGTSSNHDLVLDEVALYQ